MAIKNMPNFDDIEIEDNSKKSNKTPGVGAFDSNNLFSNLTTSLSDMSNEDIEQIKSMADSLITQILGDPNSQKMINDEISKSISNFTPLDDDIEFEFDDDFLDDDDEYMNEQDQYLNSSNNSNNKNPLFKELFNDEYNQFIDKLSNLSSPTEKDIKDIADFFKKMAAAEMLQNGDMTPSMMTDSEEADAKPKTPFSKKMEEFINRADPQYTITCKQFTRNKLENVFPDFEDAEYKQTIPVSIFKNYLPDNIIDSYDIIKILDFSLNGDHKTLSFLAESTDLTKKPFSPLCFSLYYDGHEFKTYVYKYLNPIDDNGNLIKITELFSDSSLKMLTDGASELTEDMYTNLLCVLEENEMINDANYASNIFIDTTRSPLETISNLGDFVSIPTEYYKNGLFYIGYLKLNDETGAKYFVSDFDLEPKDDILKVYAKFFNSDKIHTQKIDEITKNFNSSFIENNEEFKKHVSVEPFGKDSVIIRFYSI